MNTEDLYSLIKTVSDTSNFSAKMQLMMEYRDSSLLQFVILNTYDFFKDYGYTEIKIPKRIGDLDFSSDEGQQLILTVLDDLNKGRILNTDSNWFANSFLEKFNLTSQLILIKILTKDLDIGLTAEDFEVFWPDLLPEFGFSAGYIYNERYRRMLWELQDDYYVSQAHSGIRCFIIKHYNGKIKVYTKRRREVVVVKKLIDELEHLMRNQYAVVIEGFLKRADEDGNILKLDQRRLGKTKVQMQRPRFLVFDIIPLHNFIHKTDCSPFFERYELLKSMFGQMYNYRLSEYQVIEDTDGTPDYRQVDLGPYSLQYTSLVKQHRVCDKTIQMMIPEWLTNKWSGLIFRKNTPFYAGQSSDILKMTQILVSNFEVIEIVKARKDYYNNKVRTGRNIVKQLVIKHKSKFVFVSYGFDEEFAIKYGTNPELIKGKHITVAYTNEDVTIGLRHPMFIKIVENT